MTVYTKASSPSCDRTTAPRRDGEAHEVRAYSLGRLLRVSGAGFVKMDIEGAEHGLPELLALPGHVRVLVAELHLQRPGHRESAVRLRDSFREQGFEQVRAQRWTERAWNHNGGLGPMIRLGVPTPGRRPWRWVCRVLDHRWWWVVRIATCSRCGSVSGVRRFS